MSPAVPQQRVESSWRALRESSRHLRRQSPKIEQPASLLLLFYATECILKAEVLRRRGVAAWEDLAEDIRSRLMSHDVQRLARELRLAPDLVRELRDCRTTFGGSLAPGRIHEAWRYGTKLDARDEARFAAALEAAQSRVEREFVA